MRYSEYKEKTYAKDPELKARVNEELRQMKIGEELRTARKQAKMTQIQIAEKMQVNRSYISQIETGPQNITLSTLIRYAETLGKHIHLQVA